MTLEVLKALAVIFGVLFELGFLQELSYVSVLPENALRVVNVPSDCSKSAIPVMELFFARAQVTRIYLSKCKKLLSQGNQIQVGVS